MRVDYKFESIIDFYNNCEIFDEKYGNLTEFNRFKFYHDLDPNFIGLKLTDITKYKFQYKKTIDNIFKQNNISFDKINSVKKSTRWSYDDGKELHIEKMINELPFLKNTKKAEGIKRKDKFVNININLAIPFYINAKNLIWKGITTAFLVNQLELNGYKVKVTIYRVSTKIGFFGEENINTCIFKIYLKRYEDPINLPLILTTVSPWLLRYWIFKFCAGHFNVNDSYGSPISFIPFIEEAPININIDSNECISQELMDVKIQELKDKKIII